MDGLLSYLRSKKYTEEQLSDISASLNSSGHLIVTFADGNTVDCGDAKGADGANGTDGTDGSDGADGVSVTNAEINNQGHLIIMLSNNNTIDAGAVSSPTIDLSAAVVTLSASSYTYDGASKVPSVTSVTLNGQTLTAGTDYAVVSSPATNAGAYTLTVNGIGNYSGTVTANWTITKAQATISGADSISVTGIGESESETYTTTGDGALSFSISDSSVATLSSSGGQVTLTGVAAGSATLTVTVADGTNYTGTTKTVSVAVTEASTGTVFGVVWDYSLSSPALTRLTTLTDPLGVVTNCPATEPTACIGTSGGSSEFDNYLPWSGMVRKNYANGELVDFTGYDNGETYVFIPEFWSKIVDDSEHSKMYIYISSGALTGFTKHPGSGRYVGRYQCNTSMKSETGGTLRTSATLNDVRNAIVQTSNHYVFDVHTYMALVLLYTVEFASLDSQTMIGAGISSGSSVSTTGQTDVLAHHTGRVSGETESLCAMHYRWVENIYGNVNDFIDGVIVENSVVKLCSSPSDYAQSSAYVSTEISVPVWTSQAFITALTAYGNCYLFPKTLGGSDTTYLCDSYYSASGTNCVIVGSAYGGGTKAGIFYWNSGSASNIQSANNGSRPIIIPGGDSE